MATRQQICRVRILRMSRVLADAFSARFVLILWLARLADICQAVLPRLGRLKDIHQARLAKDEYGKFYANLASLANMASVG